MKNYSTDFMILSFSLKNTIFSIFMSKLITVPRLSVGMSPWKKSFHNKVLHDLKSSIEINSPTLQRFGINIFVFTLFTLTLLKMFEYHLINLKTPVLNSLLGSSLITKSISTDGPMD